MPPWRPVPGVNKYLNDRSLTATQIDLLARWIDAGTPVGDARHVPAAPVWPDGWQLGHPDLVVSLSEGYALPADGPDVYRNFVIPLPTRQTRFVNGWELRAGTRAIHHAILNIDRLGLARARDEREPGPGFSGLDVGNVQSPEGFFLVWTPGKVPTPRSRETSWRIDAHTDLVLQLHMQPSGKPEMIRPSIGLYFADAPPTVPQFVLRIGDDPIDIAPGDPHYVLSSTYVLPADVEIRSVFPHAHYIARKVRVWATPPGASAKDLLRIDDWDFAWQDQYVFAHPLRLPAGSILGMEFVYDNSSGNPRNPNHPPRRVTTGERSIDEMGNVTFEVVPLGPNGMALLRESKYRLLADRDPSARNLYNLANALADLGSIDEAVARYRRAIEIDPTLSPARYNLAGLLMKRGEIDSAIEELERVIARRPDADARVNLGAALEMKGRLDDAITQYRSALSNEPESAVAHGALALALLKKSDVPGAIDEFERGLALDPNNWLAHYYLGNALRDRGRIDEATIHYRRAAELQPGAREPREALAALSSP
jgi:tetratricopeptide (TPR) repeat protein